MALNDDKGNEWMEKAEKKLKSFSFFGSQNAKIEEACDLYIKGANAFKLSKKCNK